MNWYMQSGKEADIVFSTRIRLARNINGFKFNLQNKEEIEKLENKIKDNLFAIGYGLKFFKLKNMDDITKMSLVEKNILSPKFVLENNETGAFLMNDDENICITINDEDHIRLQVFCPGLDLVNTLNLAIEIDQKMGDILGYAVNKKYGFLTSCPSNCGTGLKASVMVHLPALAMTKSLDKVFRAINNFGINISGLYGENSKSLGDIFQISNEQTLGITEKDIINNLRVIVEKIITQERTARKFLINDGIELEDKVYRNYGILCNCRKIDSKEILQILSCIKLGTDLGVLKEVTDFKIQKLYILTKPANLQKFLGKPYDAIERDIKRAEIVKQILNSNE